VLVVWLRSFWVRNYVKSQGVMIFRRDSIHHLCLRQGLTEILSNANDLILVTARRFRLRDSAGSGATTERQPSI
jgi:hypothetical protein